MLSSVVLVSILVLFGLLVWGRVAAFKLFVGLVFVYVATDLLSLKDFLSNFVNEALITLVLLLIVGSVLERTTFFSGLTSWLMGKSTRTSILRMGFSVGGASAFLNNTAIVATFMTLIGRSKAISPSQLLLPLTYIATLGGTLTLVGTSTNLIVNSFLIKAGLPPLAMFDFFYVGIFLLVFGTLVIVLVAPWVLPNKAVKETSVTEYFIEAKLSSDSELVGLSIEKAGLRHLEDLFLAQVISGDNIYSPVSPKQVLRGGDRLVFVGNIKAAPKLLLFKGLSFSDADEQLKRNDQFVEVIVSQHSPMVGLSIKQANFRNKFDAAVVAIYRGDETLQGRLSDIIVQAGDALVLLVGKDFDKRDNLKQNFYFYNPLETDRSLGLRDSSIVAASFLSVIALSALDWIPLLKGLMFLLVGYLLMGFISVAEARRKIPFELVLIIGSALGIAQVLSSTGAAATIASTVMDMFGVWGIWGAFIAIYLLTVIITELVTNNAAAALAFPIALATAESLGVSIWPFIMAVVYGASASFLTPYGYQTNLMVYSAGGYRFTDYAKLGAPLTLVYGITAITMIPIFFPF